jgi:hypothetical protein
MAVKKTSKAKKPLAENKRWRATDKDSTARPAPPPKKSGENSAGAGDGYPTERA